MIAEGGDEDGGIPQEARWRQVALVPQLLAISQDHCTEIALKLNNRPRKRLGFGTPIERLLPTDNDR